MKLLNDDIMDGASAETVSERVMDINAYVPIYDIRRTEAKLRHLLRTPSLTPHQGKANQIMLSVCTTLEEDEARVQSLSSRGR